jgi:hypothetical protein
MWFLQSNVGAWTGASWRSSQALKPKEFAGNVERLARGLQENKIGGEDVHHALSDVKLSSQAGLRQQFCITARVVEQDLVLADVKQDRR